VAAAERTLNKVVRMRSVRCDVCGTKALMAASTCPKCGHGIQVRDGFGELLPLAHCSTCDSYYPESVGSCRWCGTKPDRAASIGPYIWKGFGILTFASLAIGAWLVHKHTPATPQKPAQPFDADTLPTTQPKTETVGVRRTLAQRDSIGAPPSDTALNAPTPIDSTRQAIVAANTDTAVAPPTSVVPAPSEPVALQSAGSVVQPEPATPVDSAPAVVPAPAPAAPPVVAHATRPPARDLSRPTARSDRTERTDLGKRSTRAADRATAKAPPRAIARAPRTSSRSAATPPARVIAKAPVRVAPAPKSTRSKASGRWVSSVARNWAIVRSDPSRQARIVAAIGPNTRVQLGETRGAWRRIKAKGLAGWVEHRTLLAAVTLPKRTGRLAAR
jgi:hypothetical protein